MKKVTLVYIFLLSCVDLNAKLFCEVLNEMSYKNLSIFSLDELSDRTLENSQILAEAMADAILANNNLDSVLSLTYSPFTINDIFTGKPKTTPEGVEIFPCSKFESDKTTTYVCKKKNSYGKNNQVNEQINLRLLKDSMSMNIEKQLLDRDPVTGGNFKSEFNAICSSRQAN